MNRSILVVSTIIAILLLSTTACGDDELINVKVVESQIYNEIKTHREANGKTGPFVHQYIMVKEAQLFSAKMAYGVDDVDTTGISVHWDMIDDKLGGYNQSTLVLSTTDPIPAIIVQSWAEDSLINQILLGDYTQCGVGVEYGNNQVAYITVMMMKVDS